MQLSVTRRLRASRPNAIGAWAVLGFGAGLALGFLLSEGVGAGGSSRAKRLVKRLRKTSVPGIERMALVARIRAALAAEPALAGESVEPLPAGPLGLALHGWASSRTMRTRAWRLAQSAADGVPVANRVLVRGEDEAPPAESDSEEPRSA